MAMPAVISTKPSRQPSISSSKPNQSRSGLVALGPEAKAKAGITQVSGWKSNRAVLNTTGCSHQRPQASQHCRGPKPACFASHQTGSAVQLRARA